MKQVHETMVKAAAREVSPLSAGERTALLRKYQTLAAWRRTKDTAHAAGGDQPSSSASWSPSSSPPTARTALRALSREFPGALRELDVLGLAEISRRVERLSAGGAETAPGAAATTTPPDDRWMDWIAAYHATMRAALAIKRAAGRQREVPAQTAATGVHAPDQASVAGLSSGGIVLDDSFVRAVLRPPAGRLGIVVLTTLAAHFGVPASEISHTLFPPRRPPPYTLSTP